MEGHTIMYAEGTATAAAVAQKMLGNSSPDEPSFLMEVINGNHERLSALDNSLANLARKLKPVKVELPVRDESGLAKASENSPAIMQLSSLNERIYWLQQNIEALTDSLQV